MFKFLKNKVLTSLLVAGMVVPALPITANAAANAPISVNHMGSSVGASANQFAPFTGAFQGNWDMPNFSYDADGNLIDSFEDPYTGKTDITKTLPGELTAAQRREKDLARRISLAQKCAAEANNPALPFIKVSMQDFLCIYGPMYGNLGARFESCYFDSARYAADYPDVVAAVGNSHAALWNHYKNSGIYEGRIGYVVNLYGETTNTANIYWDLAKVWTPQMTDREIVVWVNKWMCDHMTYGYTANSGGVHSGRCGNYAGEFRTIMCNLGIPVITIGDEGAPGHHMDIRNPDNAKDPHDWNLVYVDNQWLVVDVTWNDGDQPEHIEGPDKTAYLLVSNHPRDGWVANRISCNLESSDNIYSNGEDLL